MSCFISAAAALRQNRDAASNSRLPRAARRPPIAKRGSWIGCTRDADNAEEKSAQSAFNAAQCYARTGGKGMALNLVDVAIGHPRMSEKAEALKAAIEKLPK